MDPTLLCTTLYYTVMSDKYLVSCFSVNHIQRSISYDSMLNLPQILLLHWSKPKLKHQQIDKCIDAGNLMITLTESCLNIDQQFSTLVPYCVA